MGLWSRLKKTLKPDGYQAEIDEELAFHLASKAEEGSDARQDRLRFGNPCEIREATRAAGTIEWLASVINDARHGVRQMRRSPGLTTAVVLSLALGIGANMAILTLVEAALLRTLPVHDPGSLVVIGWQTQNGWPEKLCDSHSGSTDGTPNGPMHGSSFSPILYRQLAAGQSVYQAVIGFSDPETASVSSGGQPAAMTNIQYVSPNFFEGLGVVPPRGRPFTAAEDQSGQEPAVLLSHRYWRNHFGGRSDVLGQTLRVNGVAAAVVGVLPPGFFGIKVGEWVDLYVPLAAHAVLSPRVRLGGDARDRAGYWWVRQMGRMRPGADPASAARTLSQQYQRLVSPEGVTVPAGQLPSLQTSTGARGFDPLGGESARALWILLLLVALLLLIICANVANLLLARAVTRQRESAVRLALGAGRGRLLRQHLVESLTMAAAGGVAGFFGGRLLAMVLQRRLNLPELDLGLSARLVAFTVGISLATAIAFGLAPALRLSAGSLNGALKIHTRSLTTRMRLSRTLVVAQIALCLTVLVAAGLLTRSLAKLKATDLGFAAGNIVYASVDPWRSGYKAAQVATYTERLRRDIGALPGVLGVALVGSRPLSGSNSSRTVKVPGRPYVEDGSDAVIVNAVTDGALESLGIPLLAGRFLGPQDMNDKSSVVIVDERFANRFFPGRNPLGQKVGYGKNPTRQFEVVGVVKDSRQFSLRRQAMPTVYEPYVAGTAPGRPLHFLIRSGVDSKALNNLVRQTAQAVDPEVPVFQFETQNALIDRHLMLERLLSLLSSAFGTMALLLAAVGLGGLLAYAVARRRSEIGIRMALGASPGVVVRMVMRDSAGLVAGGLFLGAPCAYAVARALRSLLFGLEPSDPLTAGFALATLAAVAAVSALVPARRASRINPTIALRDE